VRALRKKSRQGPQRYPAAEGCLQGRAGVSPGSRRAGPAAEKRGNLRLVGERCRLVLPGAAEARSKAEGPAPQGAGPKSAAP